MFGSLGAAPHSAALVPLVLKIRCSGTMGPRTAMAYVGLQPTTPMPACCVQGAWMVGTAHISSARRARKSAQRYIACTDRESASENSICPELQSDRHGSPDPAGSCQCAHRAVGGRAVMREAKLAPTTRVTWPVPEGVVSRMMPRCCVRGCARNSETIRTQLTLAERRGTVPTSSAERSEKKSAGTL
jgi:hypothetical protein